LWAAAVALALVTVAALTVSAVAHPATRPVPAPLVTDLAPVDQAAPSPPAAPAAAPSVPDPLGPVALTGCPPPPPKPGPGGSPRPGPWRPAVLVPESALPLPPAPSPRSAGTGPVLAGKGMWIWQPDRTEQGNAGAIVTKALAAGLTQLWVRVGDSRYGFYGASFLASLVPIAHARGLAVIGWGFPHLYDPVGDAAWTLAALAWHSPTGERLDGWSADIETASEGTALSGRRATTYLGLVRPAVGGRPLVATVFPPTDYWLRVYPYEAMAPYVDAFAPMIYWSCREPGDAAAAAIQRLAPLAPVHLIGQAYDMAPAGGRVGHPSGAEISRFLDVARRDGAVGASFWDWQEINAEEWSALSNFSWLAPGTTTARVGVE